VMIARRTSARSPSRTTRSSQRIERNETVARATIRDRHPSRRAPRHVPRWARASSLLEPTRGSGARAARSREKVRYGMAVLRGQSQSLKVSKTRGRSLFET
jgi:hypothetical protein